MSDRDGAVIFDLEPDDDGAAPGAPSSPDAAAPPDVSRFADPFGAVREYVARQPRRRVVGALVSAVVVLTLAVGGSMAFRAIKAATAERERLTALAAAPGGVPDVTGGKLQEVWSTPVAGWPVGVLPGLVVVQDDAEVVALRASDGAEAWRVELGASIECAAQGQRELASQATSLTCLSGPDDDRQVTVLGVGGVSVQRDLDTTGRQVFPGPGESVVAIERTGEAPPPSPVYDGLDAFMAAYPDGITAGQGAIVSVEDAATGDQRWTDEIAFTPVTDVAMCGFEAVGENSFRLDLAATAQAGATVIYVAGCGIDTTYLPDGTRLGGDLDPAQGRAYVQVDPDGGFVESRQDGSTILRDEKGRERYRIASAPLLPLTTDGRSDRRLGTDTSGRLTLLAADGTPVWTNDGGRSVDTVIGRVGGVVVGQSGSGDTLVGINLADGSVAWSTPMPAGVGTYGSGVGGAVNDGTTIVFQLAGYEDSTQSSTLAGVDVHTGELWTMPRGDSYGILFAVDGAVIEAQYPADSVLGSWRTGDEAPQPSGTVRRLAPPEE